MNRPGLGLGFKLGLNIHAAEGPIPIDFSSSFTDLNTGLFGTDGTTSGNSSSTKTGSTDSHQVTSESLKIDKTGLLKMIEDALAGASGLADIFGQESTAGLFDSSVAKTGTENLLAAIAGELAKVTGVKTSSSVGGEIIEASETTSSETTTEGDGLFDNLNPFSGGFL